MSRQYRTLPTTILAGHSFGGLVDDEIGERRSSAGCRKVVRVGRTRDWRHVMGSILPVCNSNDNQTRNCAAIRQESHVGESEVELRSILGVQDYQHRIAFRPCPITL